MKRNQRREGTGREGNILACPAVPRVPWKAPPVPSQCRHPPTHRPPRPLQELASWARSTWPSRPSHRFPRHQAPARGGIGACTAPTIPHPASSRDRDASRARPGASRRFAINVAPSLSHTHTHGGAHLENLCVHSPTHPFRFILFSLFFLSLFARKLLVSLTCAFCSPLRPLASSVVSHPVVTSAPPRARRRDPAPPAPASATPAPGLGTAPASDSAASALAACLAVVDWWLGLLTGPRMFG